MDISSGEHRLDACVYHVRHLIDKDDNSKKKIIRVP